MNRLWSSKTYCSGPVTADVSEQTTHSARALKWILYKVTIDTTMKTFCFLSVLSGADVFSRRATIYSRYNSNHDSTQVQHKFTVKLLLFFYFYYSFYKYPIIFNTVEPAANEKKNGKNCLQFSSFLYFDRRHDSRSSLARSLLTGCCSVVCISHWRAAPHIVTLNKNARLTRVRPLLGAHCDTWPNQIDSNRFPWAPFDWTALCSGALLPVLAS